MAAYSGLGTHPKLESIGFPKVVDRYWKHLKKKLKNYKYWSRWVGHSERGPTKRKSLRCHALVTVIARQASTLTRRV
ncbi:unnamed protein product [Dovyalis caffra]|uniref:Uncharacterized protein n=1 Tax=Dovyalis caffra TaxID=77055 RepID=A0AAV1SDN7_9ROSI|nr:unnamed protein product [Dovyalis caffra]